MEKVIVFHLLILVLASDALLAENNTVDVVAKTFEFIDQARAELQLPANKNLILVVGSEQSDKSLLIHYVAGDYSKLTSIEPGEHETEYRILDGFDTETGNNESIFRALVPKMVVDDAENVWYDFPGPEPTGNQTVEIATAFLSNSVVQHAENVKIVLVVNCLLFTEEFDSLLTQATKLMKNVDRYNSSVSLVVTKVPAYWRKTDWSNEMFEESMKTSTVKFLRAHRSAEQEKGLNMDKIQLIDALLERTSRTSTFWHPDAAGTFDTIDEMAYGRRQIRQSILEHTSYSKIQENDFGYPLTEAAQIIVANMGRPTRDSITTILMSIDNCVLVALQHSIQSIEDFRDRQSFLRAVTSTNPIITFEEATLHQLTKLNIKLNISSINIERDRIKRYEDNLNILNMLAQTKVIFSVSEWIVNASQANEYATTEYNWYSFLVEVFEYFDRAEVQQNVSIYNVANLSDWGQLNKPQGLTIDENNFHEFKKQFPKHPVVKISALKLKELNDIIHFTLMPAPQFECDRETMTIKGLNVKSSHIQPSKCPSNFDLKINVFAVDTFYVDGDLNLTGHRELNIFADKWEVLKTATFHLIGLNGKALTRSRAQLAATAGYPGNAGANAANFFGMANELVNGNALTVNFTGGSGADGQDGTGSNDTAAVFTVRVHRALAPAAFTSSSVLNYYTKLLEAKGYKAEYIAEHSELSDIHLKRGSCKLKFRIHPNKCCGRTGMGGAGGLGGHSGNFLFVHTGNHESDSPNISTSDGLRGSDGRNATPCKNTALDIWIDVNRQAVRMHNLLFNLNVYFNGKFTIANRVDSNMCRTEYAASSAATHPPTPIEPIKFPSKINEYKTFLRANLNDPSHAIVARKTYDAIESNAKINSAYSVADFVVEANALEKQFYELNEFVDLLPFYNSLLKRIDAYGMSNEGNVSASVRKVLALISSTILSKTMSMRSNRKADLIIDIENSFDSIAQEITQSNETGRIQLVNQQRINDNDDIMAKINETNEYIENDVQHEIEKLYTTFDNELEYVMDEPMQMQANTDEEIKMQEENGEMARRNLCIRMLTGLLHFVAGTIPLFGLAWKSAVGAISAITTTGLYDPETKEFVRPAELKSDPFEHGAMYANGEQDKINGFEKELHKLVEFLKIRKTENLNFDDKVNSLKSKHSIVFDDAEQQSRASEQLEKLVAIERVRDMLHTTTWDLIGSLSGLRSANGVRNCLLKIDEAITLIIHIYDRTQNYQEQSELVVCMNDLHTADYRDVYLNDAQLNDDLSQLQFNFETNLILTQYVRAVNAFKQAVFPFAGKYLDMYRLPATFASDQNMETVAATAADKIKSLKEHVNQLNSTAIIDKDASIHTAYFDRSGGTAGPFYEWPNDEVRDKIQQLFAGKKIYLLADVTQAGTLNAVKFDIINVEFRSRNQTTNDLLVGILQSFHISLTHMGESNYRCDDQFYTISSRPQTIEYSFAKENQVPVVRNAVYDTLSRGVSTLSPYTLWAMQLAHGQFDKLTPFVDSVDIELHGHGQYVSDGATICNSDLEQFYSPLPARPKIASLPRRITAAANTLTHIPTHTFAAFVALVLVHFMGSP